MMHFLDRSNSIYPLETQWKFPLNKTQLMYDIQIMKIIIVLSNQQA